MSDQFKAQDAFRFALEKQTTAVAEAKERIARKAENALFPKLLKFAGAVKLTASSTNLTLVEGPNTTSKLFDGTITVKADLPYGGGEVAVDVPVTQNEIALPEDQDLIELIDLATQKGSEGDLTTDMALSMAEPLYASLDSFHLIDDGSNMLKIYHTAVDSGRALGIVSKNEYKSIQNKEAFLKEVLENRVLKSDIVNHFTLEFKGSFVEPSITKVADEKHKCAHCDGICAETERLCPDCKDKDDQSKKASEVVEKDVLRASQADSFRQAVEKEASKIVIAHQKLADRVANSLIPHLRALAYEDVKVSAVDSSALESNESGISGEVAVSTTLVDGSAIREATFMVAVQNGEYKLPKKEAIAAVVSQAEDLKAKVEDALAAEALASIEQIDKDEEVKAQMTEAALDDVKITKTAGDAGGMQFFGPTDVLKLNKNLLNLPEDMEIGETIFADGFHWKLTSKDQSQLSAGKDDGSIWTFTKCSTDDKKPEHELGI